MKLLGVKFDYSMFTQVDKRILHGFIVSFVLLFVILMSSYRNMNLYLVTSERVVHTHQVLNHIQKIYSELLEIETSQRGFSIYNDDSFRSDYNGYVGSIYQHLDTLHALVKDNPVQLANADTLSRLIGQKIAFTDMVIKARLATPDSLPVLVTSLQGKKLKDAIKTLSQRMQHHENLLLEERMKFANSAATDSYVIYFCFCLFILLIFTGVIAVVRNKMAERYESEKAIQKASDKIRDLYDNAPCGYHSLDKEGAFVEANHTFLKWLGREKDEGTGQLKFVDLLTENSKQVFYSNFPGFKENGFIEGVEFELIRKDGSHFFVILNSTAIYDEDGNYIQSRSSTFDISPRKEAEEKANFLNRELEAFNYSVSHDLRAPLRAIDSYTKILEHDYSGILDEEGRRLIRVVLQNAARMNHLIEDLLDFSRLGRKELLMSGIDLDILLREVIAEMEEEMKGRKVKFDIDTMDKENGDRSMIKQVWHNLISNALKYTRKRAVAEIKIGAMRENGSRVYFIRDNGAGFDMKYYKKLFGVFMRLHSAKEFEGTGVGLAFCHRIISRHGGRIWAEAGVDNGAVFYFTLNENIKQLTHKV